jgi:hypothetical protein
VIEVALGGNLIGDYGARSLGQMLGENSTLLTLNLAGRKSGYSKWAQGGGAFYRLCTFTPLDALLSLWGAVDVGHHVFVGFSFFGLLFICVSCA